MLILHSLASFEKGSSGSRADRVHFRRYARWQPAERVRPYISQHRTDIVLTSHVVASASVTGGTRGHGLVVMLQASCNLLSTPWQSLASAWAARSISQVY